MTLAYSCLSSMIRARYGSCICISLSILYLFTLKHPCIIHAKHKSCMTFSLIIIYLHSRSRIARFMPGTLLALRAYIFLYIPTFSGIVLASRFYSDTVFSSCPRSLQLSTFFLNDFKGCLKLLRFRFLTFQ